MNQSSIELNPNSSPVGNPKPKFRLNKKLLLAAIGIAVLIIGSATAGWYSQRSKINDLNNQVSGLQAHLNPTIQACGESDSIENFGVVFEKLDTSLHTIQVHNFDNPQSFSFDYCKDLTNAVAEDGTTSLSSLQPGDLLNLHRSTSNLVVQIDFVASHQVTKVSEDLPKGRKLIYPLTATNASILWWSDEYVNSSNDAGNIIGLSSDKIVHFLSTIPSATQVEVCGNGDISAIDITVQYLDVRNKGLEGTHFETCMDKLAQDSQYGAEATSILNEVGKDIQRFVDSAVIK